VGRYDYTTFGSLRTQIGSDVSRFKFSSKERDPSTGFSYYGYRFYAPQWLRWISQDLIGEIQDINLFRVVANNPVGILDPLGLGYGNPVPSRVIGPPIDSGPPVCEVTWLEGFLANMTDPDGYGVCFLLCLAKRMLPVEIGTHAGAKPAAGAYYHFTDKRFTAWGKCSKVLVPRASCFIKRFVFVVTGPIDAWKCYKECKNRL
jgi:RHS repeat-associated protein